MNLDKYIGIAGFLIGIFGITLSYITYRKSRRSKSLCYDIEHNNLIKDFSVHLSGLSVKYKNKGIKNLTSTKLVFWNSGSEIIDKSDVVEKFPLLIFAAENIKILDVQLLEFNNFRNDISARIMPDQDCALIEFDFLDSQDGGTIQIMHTGTGVPCELLLLGTIKGIKKFSIKSTRPTRLSKKRILRVKIETGIVQAVEASGGTG